MIISGFIKNLAYRKVIKHMGVEDMKYISNVFKSIIVTCLLVFMAGYAAYAEPAAQRIGDTVKVFGDVYINSGDMVTGNVVTVWGNVYVNGPVMGNVVAVFGDIKVDSNIMGNAVTISGKVNVGSNGSVLGNIVNPGNRVFEFLPFVFFSPLTGLARAISSLASTAGLLLLAAIVYAIIPKKVTEMAGTIENNIGRKIGIGILTMIGSPIAMVLLSIILAITIIGIIVIPFAWIAYLAAGLIALVPVYLYTGGRVAKILKVLNTTPLTDLAIGMFSIWAVKAIFNFGGIFTAWISPLISIVFYVIGVGTLIDYILSNNKKKHDDYNYNPISR
jgi:hypothetical protein